MTGLPPDLPPNLTALLLSSNLLTAIPHSIGKLHSSLTSLDLAHNQVRHLATENFFDHQTADL